LEREDSGGFLRPHLIAARALVFGLVAVFSGTAFGDYACTNSEAVRQVARLELLERTEELGGINQTENIPESGASVQRKAVMAQLLKQYCFQAASLPAPEAQEPMKNMSEFGCVLYSGVLASKNIYWFHCEDWPSE
jgi:hypothetical protein